MGANRVALLVRLLYYHEAELFQNSLHEYPIELVIKDNTESCACAYCTENTCRR